MKRKRDLTGWVIKWLIKVIAAVTILLGAHGLWVFLHSDQVSLQIHFDLLGKGPIPDTLSPNAYLLFLTWRVPYLESLVGEVSHLALLYFGAPALLLLIGGIILWTNQYRTRSWIRWNLLRSVYN